MTHYDLEVIYTIKKYIRVSGIDADDAIYRSEVRLMAILQEIEEVLDKSGIQYHSITEGDLEVQEAME